VRAKLASEQIRATLSFAGLLLVVYEMVKQAVVGDVRQFYCRGFDETGMLYDEARYARDVRSLDKSQFRASAKWLVKSGAITDEQVEVLERLHRHRQDIAHELPKYLIDPEHNPDVTLFIEAMHALTALRKFWLQTEIDIGTFEEHGDVTVDDVQNLGMELLRTFISAFADGLPGEPASENSGPPGISTSEAI
jgi:hypothetical protein